jgi:hypothetical protein
MSEGNVERWVCKGKKILIDFVFRRVGNDIIVSTGTDTVIGQNHTALGIDVTGDTSTVPRNGVSKG